MKAMTVIEEGITDADVAFADEVLEFNRSSFLGGSYTVKAREAGDIDIIVPLATWPDTLANFGDRIQPVLQTLPDPEPDERLVCVYRRGHVDLIVIADDYVGAYRSATRDIASDPVRFAERPARVAIHVFYADEVRVRTGRLTEAELRAKRSGSRSADYDKAKP